MKIAITGHTAGIGQTFSQLLLDRGHEIVGLSKRTGDNIRITPKIADKIEPCDMWINNAQASYAQTELLFEMARRWQEQRKHIWVIGTMMTQQVTAPTEYTEYYNQKQTLDLAVAQIRHQQRLPVITVIRPGGVATQGQPVGDGFCDVNEWCATVIDTVLLAESRNMIYNELSLGYLRLPTGL